MFDEADPSALQRPVRQAMRGRQREGQRFDRQSALARESRGAAMLTFATGVAHELSTPLGVIAMRSEPRPRARQPVLYEQIFTALVVAS